MKRFEKAVLSEIETFGEAMEVLIHACSEELQEAALKKMIELSTNLSQINEVCEKARQSESPLEKAAEKKRRDFIMALEDLELVEQIYEDAEVNSHTSMISFYRMMELAQPIETFGQARIIHAFSTEGTEEEKAAARKLRELKPNIAELMLRKESG